MASSFALLAVARTTPGDPSGTRARAAEGVSARRQPECTPASAGGLPGAPAQQPVLQALHGVVGHEPEPAEHHDAREDLLTAEGARGEQHPLADAGLGRQHLRGHRDDEGDRDGDPHAGEDLGEGVRELELDRALPAGEAQHPGDLDEAGIEHSKPWMAPSRIGQIEPNTTTKRIIASDSPSSRIAAGKTAEAGSGRRNSAVGSKRLRATADEAMAAPTTTPVTVAASHPASIRQTVLPSGSQISPEAIQVHSVARARSGPGNHSGLTSRVSAASFQATTARRRTATLAAGPASRFTRAPPRIAAASPLEGREPPVGEPAGEAHPHQRRPHEVGL